MATARGLLSTVAAMMARCQIAIQQYAPTPQHDYRLRNELSRDD